MPRGEKEREQNARIALLKHYSSKTSMHGTVVLSTIVGIVVFIQVIPVIQSSTAHLANPIVQSLVQSSIYGICLGSLVFFLLRSVTRLLLWGKLASYIISIRMDRVEKEAEMPMLQRLHYACAQQTKQNHPQLAWLARKFAGARTFLSFWVLAIAVVFAISLTCLIAIQDTVNLFMMENASSLYMTITIEDNEYAVESYFLVIYLS